MDATEITPLSHIKLELRLESKMADGKLRYVMKYHLPLLADHKS